MMVDGRMTNLNWSKAMNKILMPLLALALCLSTTLAYAESPALSTASGKVEKVEKETIAIHTGDKPGKTVKLTITGTSRFTLLSPQVRDGKTILTQRSAELSDLTPGQAIAIIYTSADKDTVLLHAVITATEPKK